MDQTPTIGRIVVYNTTESQQKALETMGCNSSKQLPAVIVAVWGTTPQSVVNLKVMTDGRADDLWITSVGASQPDENGVHPTGSWNWPARN